MLPDFCDWWTPDRILESDIAWREQEAYLEFADAIRAVAHRFPINSVLELGCGMGYVGREIHSEFDYLGIDGNADMIAMARKHNADWDTEFPHFEVGNIRNLRTIRKPVDLVCSFGVLKHFSLADWKDIVAKMLAVGRYGLIELITTYGPSVDTGEQNNEGYHHIYINLSELPGAWLAAGHRILAYSNLYPVDTDKERWFVLSERI